MLAIERKIRLREKNKVITIHINKGANRQTQGPCGFTRSTSLLSNLFPGKIQKVRLFFVFCLFVVVVLG